MGLSNYLASSRISQSGVCTSTTRPASPYEGQVIYESDTDRVLVWNASAWVAPNSTTVKPPGLELVKTQTVGTGVSSLTVTDAFSANYDSYKITYTGGSSSTNGNISFAFTGSPAGWTGNIIFANFASGVPASIGASTVTQCDYIASSNSLAPQANIDIQNPFLAIPSYASGVYIDASNAGRAQYVHTVSTSYTGFILATPGAWTGGIIRVYGYRE